MRRRVLPVLVCGALVTGLSATACAQTIEAPLSVSGTALDGATVPTGSEVRAALPDSVSVTFVLDGTYLGTDASAPFTWTLQAPPGEHRLKVRATDARGARTRAEARFTVAGTSAQPTAPAPQPAAEPTAPAPAPAPAPTGGPGEAIRVSTVEQLEAALATAAPGSVIEVADGTYTSRRRFVAAADGTASQPITLRGSRAAVLSSDGPRGDYGLHVTGDHWRIEGLTVANASKGVVLDTSVGTVLDGIEVHTIGDEGVHFRWCSRDGVLRNSLIRDTGLRAPRFGEGVYVGSASSNWSKYSCTDGRDNSENVLVVGNVFRDIPAEGADLKEGTESGVLRGNVFDNVGFSGENSADSAVDAKGNGWLIEGNVVRGASGAFLDAFQTHSVYRGYGTGNVFRGNRVEGRIPGFGFGLYPASGNTVACDNAAPGAARGLVGDGSRPGRCA